MKKVIILGKGTLAIRLGEWITQSGEFELSCVVPVIPEPTWTESLSDWATDHGIPIVSSGNYLDLTNFEDAYCLISIFYGLIFKEPFISKCNKLINLHNAPLPKYRGVSPINWALKNNEKAHGVTLHNVTPQIDAGSIIDQITYPIDPQVDEVIDVYERSLNHGFEILKRSLPRLDEIEPAEQDHTQASYYSKKQDHLLGERSDFKRSQVKS